MKLLEKLKNTFFEEEYIEVDESEVQKQEVAKKVEPRVKKEEITIAPVIEKEEVDSFQIPEENIEEKKIENYSDSELSKKENKLPYFEEEDFIEVDLNSTKNENPKKLYGESADKLYSSIHRDDTKPNKPYSAPLKEAFKPTPIISPIYGILDKNYRKEEVVDKKDKIAGVSSYVSRKNADLDSVRKKAYGGLDPLEEVSKLDSESTHEEEKEEENLLYDMTSDHSKPVVDEVTIADAEEYFNDLGLEYNIDYKDSKYEKATGRRVKSVEKKEDLTSSDDANLEDNLFDLIDSMYEEVEE